MQTRVPLARSIGLACLALTLYELASAGVPSGAAARQGLAAAAARPAAALAVRAADDPPRAGAAAVNLVDVAVNQVRWLLSIPLGVNPLGPDETGLNCGVNQSGPVWFLSAPGGAAFNRSCTVPVGKAIAMPVASYLNDFPCPDPSFQPPADQSLEDFLRAGARFLVDGTTSATATLDNKPVRLRRVTTGVFAFTAAASLAALDSCLTGSPQLGLVDAWYLYIDPPAPGVHTLQVDVTNQYFGRTLGTITLKVQP